jgi:hypothetical protein
LSRNVSDSKHALLISNTAQGDVALHFMEVYDDYSKIYCTGGIIADFADGGKVVFVAPFVVSRPNTMNKPLPHLSREMTGKMTPKRAMDDLCAKGCLHSEFRLMTHLTRVGGNVATHIRSRKYLCVSRNPIANKSGLDPEDYTIEHIHASKARNCRLSGKARFGSILEGSSGQCTCIR